MTDGVPSPLAPDGFADRRANQDLGLASAQESTIVVSDLGHLHCIPPIFESSQNDGGNATHREMVAIYHTNNDLFGHRGLLPHDVHGDAANEICCPYGAVWSTA